MSKAKGGVEQVQEPGYKMFHADTMGLLDAIGSCKEIVDELCGIPVDAPSAEDLSSAKLLCDCLCSAVFNTIPCPAQPAPLGVPGPWASNAADPEYTQVLPVSPGRRDDAFETTTVRQAFNFDVKTDDPEFKATCGIPVKTGTAKRGLPQPLRSPSNTSKTPGTQSRAQERPSFMGTFDLIRADRPPSAADVRQASKRKSDEQQKLQLSKQDVSVIRQVRLDEMARALAAEAKGGRKLEKLPEDAQYICDDDGRIVGVGFQNGKNYTESVSSTVQLKKEQEKRPDTRAEDASRMESRKSLLDETKAKYNHSLYGKDIAQAQSRTKRRF